MSNDNTYGLSMYCTKAIEQNVFPHANTYNNILMHIIYDYNSRMPDINISQLWIYYS